MSESYAGWELSHRHCPVCQVEDATVVNFDNFLLELSPHEDLPEHSDEPVAEILNKWMRTTLRGPLDALHIGAMICTRCHTLSTSITKEYDAEALGNAGEQLGVVFPTYESQHFLVIPGRREPPWLTSWIKKQGIEFEWSILDQLDDPKVFKELPASIRLPALKAYSLARLEVMAAITSDLQMLAGSGLRTMLDILVTAQTGYGHPHAGGSFADRLDELFNKSMITRAEHTVLRATMNWGHKATHAAVRPPRETLIHAFSTLEELAPKLLLDDELLVEFLSVKPRQPKIHMKKQANPIGDKVVPFPKDT